MAIIRHEGYNLHFGDVLSCSACGEDLYHVAAWIRFADIGSAYYRHAAKCRGLRELIRIDKNKKQAELLIAELEPTFKRMEKFAVSKKLIGTWDREQGQTYTDR